MAFGLNDSNEIPTAQELLPELLEEMRKLRESTENILEEVKRIRDDVDKIAGKMD